MPGDEELEGQERPAEPDLAGLRDRALLLVGFVAALRRSELAALTVDAIAEHSNGLVLSIPRSKMNQTGEHVELVVLPRARMPAHCPVTALKAWLDAAGIVERWHPDGLRGRGPSRPEPHPAPGCKARSAHFTMSMAGTVAAA